jgi:hypothetical protein
MRTHTLGILAILLSAGIVHAQNDSPTLYAESFRKGPTRITEDKFDTKVTSQDPIYKQRLRDSAGAERYELTINPVIGEGQGNNNITSWQVSLRDLRHPVYGNVLQFDPELSQYPKDNLYWLNPVHTAVVPINAERVIKVESFYVAFQVKDYHFSPADSPYLDFMTVHLELSNKDPRNAAKP